KPERSRVSEYCTTLTRLSQNDVDCGASYFGACALLEKEYFARERVWASFGDYDRRQFQRQCRARNIRYPFGPTHLNVKNLFAIAYGSREELGMVEVLQRLNLPLEGNHHRANDDAWNIANILCFMLMQWRVVFVNGQPMIG